MKMVDSFEKIPLETFPDALAGSKFAATEIAKLIRKKQAEKKNCVLGLATGSTPLKLYGELVRMHKEEGLSFANVIAFNLDEYYPIEPAAPQSYATFMKKYLFSQVDINPANCHIPSGQLPKSEIRGHCAEYEKAID